jgi:hypothetical protein
MEQTADAAAMLRIGGILRRTGQRRRNSRLPRQTLPRFAGIAEIYLRNAYLQPCANKQTIWTL